MAPDIQPSEVHDSPQQASMPNVIVAGDISEDRLLETILLRVGTLERRQTELEADNKSLHDDLLRHIQHDDKSVPDHLIQSSQGCASSQPAAEIVSAGDSSQDQSLEALATMLVVLERGMRELQEGMVAIGDKLRALKLALQEQQESLRLLLAELCRLPQWISLDDKKA